MKVYRPLTPGRRGMTGISFRDVLTKKKPEKRLTTGKTKSGGRNRQGRTTARFRGGGAKRRLRDVDFGEKKVGIVGRVEAVEYDPNRTAFIALIIYVDGDRRYILAPNGLKVGDRVVTAERTPLAPGNRMRLAHIPVGTSVYGIELFPGKGAQIVRAAGASAQVLAHDAGYALVQLPSREIRKIPGDTFASIGAVSNPEWRSITIGKAGRARWMGRRPHVRGSAMNPRDHPHGGGEGRAPIGLKYPKTPWGKHALGVKTRKTHKQSSMFILQRRTKR